MRLENWSIVVIGDFYTPPEMRRQCLDGFVYGNPRFADGEHITTSGIVLRPPENDCVSTVSGSLYELGEVSPEYEALYPNARERLFTFLNKARN